MKINNIDQHIGVKLKKSFYFQFIVCGMSVLYLLSACQNKSPKVEEPHVSYYEDKDSFIAARSKKSRGSVDELLGDLTDNKHRYYQPFYPVKLEVYENELPTFKNFVAMYSYESPYQPMIGIVTNSKKDIDATNQLLAQVHVKFKKNIKQRELLTNEILTKVVAYRELQKKQKVVVPIVTKDGVPKVIAYKVDQVIDLGGGMPAFGLVPKNKNAEAPPILLFRGTDLSGSGKGNASVLADLDLNGPGYVVFQSSEDEIHNWLVKVNSIYNKKTRVLGYSLGGSFVQYTCLFQKDFVSKDVNFPNVAFNEPGVSEEVAAKWKELPQSEKPALMGYVTEGDVVSTVGKLIGNVRELSLDKSLEPIAAHLTLMSAEDTLYAYRLDVTLKFEKDESVKTSEKSDRIFSLKEESEDK
ncbi:MAG: hypothetical protein S4CHLAM37_15490 [Chlamydiia bacterium]|nr:hypothetical protein [Chlamydiia bacterium]